jgi:hypothetical protein
MAVRATEGGCGDARGADHGGGAQEVASAEAFDEGFVGGVRFGHG